MRLSPHTIFDEPEFTYHLVYPANLRDWAPLAALRVWLRDELEHSRRRLPRVVDGPPRKVRKRK